MYGVTVSTKFCVSSKLGVPLSLTVMLIFDDPFILAVGVKVAVQFGAAPPYTIFAIGISAGFDDVAERFAEVHRSKLSTSVIVKFTVTNPFSTAV